LTKPNESASYARPPGHVGRIAAEARYGIGEARAVHVEAEPARAGHFTQRRDLVRRVDQSVFGRIGDRQSRRLHLMHVVADRREQGLHRVRRQLGAFALRQQQLGAVGVEFGRAAFVILDMGVAMADDALMRLAQSGQRERIGGRAGRHPKRPHLAPEQVRERAVQPFAQCIAVISRIEPVRDAERGQHFGAASRRIVREKSHGGAISGLADRST
jgi:hypothetical protein